MIREEFIEVLDFYGYSYKEEGNRVVVTHGGYTNLRGLTSLPSGVVFKNSGTLDLKSLTSLPSGVEFKNGRNIDLRSLTSLNSDIEFKNGGDIDLRSLIGGLRVEYWEGNIKGIDSKRLLNKMISLGLFKR